MERSQTSVPHSTYDILRFLRNSGINNKTQADEKADKHRRNQFICAFGGISEFFPDEHAPKRRNHGGALSETIRNGVSGDAGGDDAKRHAETPNDAAENANEMKLGISLREIICQANRFAGKRFEHDRGDKNDI